MARLDTQVDTQGDPSSATTLLLRSATQAKDPDSRYRVRIEIDLGGRLASGNAEGYGTEAVELRLAAEATIAALREATGGILDLELVGIKRIQAFDSHAVLVTLNSGGDLRARLVGAAALLDTHIAEGAALAVLSALKNGPAGTGPATRPSARLRTRSGQAPTANGSGARPRNGSQVRRLRP